MRTHEKEICVKHMRGVIVSIMMMAAAAVPVMARDRAPVPFDAFDGGLVGARPLSMGNAMVAMQNMNEASYWNPAALNFQESNTCTISLDLMRSSRIESQELLDAENLRGRKLLFISGAGRNGALSFRPLANLYTETVLDPADPARNIETREIKVNSFYLSLAHMSSDVTAMGANIGFLNGSLATTRLAVGEDPQANVADGNGFMLDWGTCMRLTENLTVGLMAHNIPGYIYWEDYVKTQLPVMLRTGFSVKLPGLMTVSAEYEKRYYRDTGFRPSITHLGIEQFLTPWIAIRGGVYGDDLNESETVSYTAGVGFAAGGYLVDLAFRKYTAAWQVSTETVYQYLMSINIPFGTEG